MVYIPDLVPFFSLPSSGFATANPFHFLAQFICASCISNRLESVSNSIVAQEFFLFFQEYYVFICMQILSAEA